VVIRDYNGQREFYLVHRPRHDDWSTPKGHIDNGETPLQAAMREVMEETGFYCSMIRQLPPYQYKLPDGREVLVHMYEMNFLEEFGESDEEVDEGRWVSLKTLAELISYPSLSEYLTSLYQD